MMSLANEDAIHTLATAALSSITPGQIRYHDPVAMEWCLRKGYLEQKGTGYGAYVITAAGREALQRANP